MKKASIFVLLLASSIHLMAQNGATNRPFNYNIRGTVPVIQQTGNTCWAAVSTMMLSWKRNQPLTMPTAIGLVGEPYVGILNSRAAISVTQIPELLRRLGMVAEPPLNYTVPGFVTLFNQKAPLWVITIEGGNVNMSHARIVTGIQGDGSINGTILTIVDPALGRVVRESYSAFARKYERAASNVTTLYAQIIHF